MNIAFTDAKACQRLLESRSAIGQLLETVLDPAPLGEILQKALAIILSVPWLTIQSKGCIFLLDPGSDTLVMVAHLGLGAELLNTCSQLSMGRCLCGRAAQARKVVFAAHVDDDHEVCFPGMLDHGHYCLPIMQGEVLLGVVNTYVAAGHEQNQEELAFLQDIAHTLAGVIQRKRAEEALQQHALSLEEQVRERTRQLMHAERLATLGGFAAGIAHEINNPNSFIMGNVDFLKMAWNVAKPVVESQVDGDASGRLTKVVAEFDAALVGIRHGAERIRDIVGGLKGHAKMGSGVRVPIALSAPVQDALQLLQHKLKKGVTVDVQIPANGVVQGNRQQLSQVFINLVNNALEAMSEFGTATRQVSITATRVAGYWQIRVRDSGPGIPDGQAQRIFAPFYTTKGETVGTGLGLFIIQEILEDHGGEIRLMPPDSQPGAHFMITLPVIDTDTA